MLDDLDLSGIKDENARVLIEKLLNLVDSLSADLRAAQAEIQRLRDENNRLKGEQGKPDIKANIPKSTDHSSERERHQVIERKKRNKLSEIVIDRTQDLVVDQGTLPDDAVFKGYEEVVVQDIVVHTDNVLFRKAKWYASSTRQSYLANLPSGYEGEFGPGVRALTLVFYYGSQMTEPKIADFFANIGIHISTGQISNLLIKGQDEFHAEKEGMYLAGLRSSPWQHIDDTATRVNGQNCHCQVITNPLHTTFVTTPSKDRLAILDVLRNGTPREFRIDDKAFVLLEWAGVSALVRRKLAPLPRDVTVDESTIQTWIDSVLPRVGTTTRKWILDATAVSAYRVQTDVSVVQALVCDGALQFTWLTEELAACWVHEGRHYKKLEPVVKRHQQILDKFLDKFWAYYRKLLAYRQSPSPGMRQKLSAEFDRLFYPNTGYKALDERITLTYFKKPNLLLVLDHPELPLHNNAAELGARMRVRKRAISFGPRTAEGVKAWDTFMSLVATTKQLGLSFYHYIYDRVAKTATIPPLADIIDQRAVELNLGASWAAA